MHTGSEQTLLGTTVAEGRLLVVREADPRQNNSLQHSRSVFGSSASRCAGSPTDLWEGAQHPFWDGVFWQQFLTTVQNYILNLKQLSQNPTPQFTALQYKFQHQSLLTQVFNKKGC